jgi:predicted ATPase/class 3 adenylate cyclase
LRPTIRHAACSHERGSTSITVAFPFVAPTAIFVPGALANARKASLVGTITGSPTGSRRRQRRGIRFEMKGQPRGGQVCDGYPRSVATPLVERAFVMADIAGSSRLWNRYPERMSAALASHDALAAAAVRGAGGEIFKHTGDGFLAAFDGVESAVDAMVTYQRALADRAGAGPIEIRSRACVHFGAAEQRGGDWFGPTLNHLARLTDLVAPTHLVLSESAVKRLDTAARTINHLGAFSVRDVPDSIPLYAVHLPHAVGPALTIAAGQGLPQFKTGLVGRDGDVAALLQLLGRERLVTVLGFGGMGKTRLAVEVARRWGERNGAPTYFVDLSSSNDPVAAVADAIGIPNGRITSETSAYETLAQYLGGSPTLLVVDNCEHIVDSAAATCDALTDATPNIRILATSREALELDGEAVYALDSLEPEAALELLHQRARAVGAAAMTAGLAARLCDRVENMPLGIELVVARLRHIDAPELADALDQSLDELRTRRRGGTERHSTMRSLIEWSYELLSDSEQSLLLRLAQLSAPWPRSVAAILGADLGPELLDALVAKSLVMPAPAGQLRILEPIRQFCDEMLAIDAAGRDAARDALVDWARDFVPELPNYLDPVFDAQATRALVEQLANIRTAIDAAIQRRHTTHEAAIMIGLWPLVTDGRFRSWFGPQIEATLARSADPDQRRTLIRIALLDTVEHHVDLEREDRLVALLRTIDPDDESAEFAFVQSNRAVRQIVVERVLGLDPIPTRELVVSSARIARAKGRRLDESVANLFTAFSYLLYDEHAAAISAAEQAAELVRRVNFVTVAALADATAAMAMEGEGDFATALEIAEAAVPLAENARWETSVRAVHALLLGRVGRHDEARVAVARIIDLALAQSVPFLLFDAVIALSAIRTTARDLPGAKEAIALTGVGRTPLTIGMTFAMAAEMEFELGLDRFAESLDPAAVDKRAERAANYLREVRPRLS